MKVIEDVPTVAAVSYDSDDSDKKGGAPVALKKMKGLTRKQVLEKSDKESLLLLIIGEKVYNCTTWQDRHPGGRLTVRALCGRDATEAFTVNHPKAVVERGLKRFFYADLVGSQPPNAVTLAYRELTLKMGEAGMFKIDPTFYYKKFMWFASLFGSVLAGVFLSDKLWVHALAGVLLGLFWQQVAFVGHDVGHNTLTENRFRGSWAGLFFGNFCTGISMTWWKRGHNVHHVITNSMEHDPDIQHMPVFAVHSDFLKKNLYSTYYNRFMVADAAAHFLVRYQHWLYYPVMAFARFNLYAQSILHVFQLGPYSKPDIAFRHDIEAAALFGFWTWLIALTLCLPNWFERVLFFVLAHNVAGILHVQITLSHFAMPAFGDDTYYEDYDDVNNSTNGFVATQLKTSMDIDCPKWLDWFHGGLQFQAVHHVWPRIPRHNLRKAQQLLISFCKEYDLSYHHEGFLAVNKTVIDKLRETSKSSDKFNGIFSESMALQG